MSTREAMTCVWCSIHEASAESLIARCFYSLWASALERCELREMELSPVQVDGQDPLPLSEGFGIKKAGGPW